MIISIVVIGRTMIGNHFKKKFNKIPPPSIIVAEVVEKEFNEWKNRFEIWEAELKVGEKEMAKYEEYKKQEKKKKLEAELAKLDLDK